MRVCPLCRSQFSGESNFCPFDGQRLDHLSGEMAKCNDEMIGKILDDRYLLESRLGEGGMGVVYAARHVVIDKPMAIKLLRKDYSKDPHQVERFIREARAASCIGHPNIVDVTDFGKLANMQIYLVMEYLSGATLAKELRRVGAMPIARVINISLQICQALIAAHAKGIVHRDLKPENIFLVNPENEPSQADISGRRRDWVKVLDFGIAKFSTDQQGRRLTRVGSIFGTPQYMSPEQAAGQDADHRGDIYSLGCIIYEMITGEVPFLADTFMGTLTKHMFEKPIPPKQLRPDLQIPIELETIILRALEKNPEARFESMTDMALLLEKSSQALGQTKHPSMMTAAVTPSATESAKGSESASAKALSPQRLHTLSDGSASARLGSFSETLPPEALPARQKNKTHSQAWIIGVGLCLLVLGGAWLFFRQKNTSSLSVHYSAETKLAEQKKVAQEIEQPIDEKHGALSREKETDAQREIVESPKREDMANLDFQSSPRGAQIFLDGKLLGNTPLNIHVKIGQTKLFQIRKEGYEELVVQSLIEKDQKIMAQLKRRVLKPEQIKTPSTQQKTSMQPDESKPVKKTPYGSLDDLKNPFKTNP